MTPGVLIQFVLPPHGFGLVLGPTYVPSKNKRCTQYQLSMMQVLTTGFKNVSLNSKVIGVHKSYLKVVE